MSQIDEQTLADAASGPKQASSDAGSMQSQDLTQLIEVLNRQAYRDALDGSPNSNGGPRSGWAFLRIGKVDPPGTR